MRPLQKYLVLAAGLALVVSAHADPDKASLLAAWEEHVRALPATTAFELTGEGSYHFADSDLGYDGALTVLGAMVRSSETAGFETGYSHMGIVEFRLDELPDERLASQGYYYWLADRQTMHFSSDENRWVDAATFKTSMTAMYDVESAYPGLSFFLDYGFWIVIFAIVFFAIIVLSRNTKKAQSLIDQSGEINQKASDNLDRSQAMQDEVLALSRESRDLLAENNELLRKILEAGRRSNQ